MNENDINQSNEALNFKVTRSILTQRTFEQDYTPGDRYSKTFNERMNKIKRNCKCSSDCVKNFFLNWFPFIKIMNQYNVREDLPGDIISGLTVGIMQIPQGMAYALLTTLSPVYGLYVSFFPVICYFFFGTSRHVSIGTFAVVSLMVGSTVEKHYESVMNFEKNMKTNDTYFTTLSINDNINATEETEKNNDLEIIKAKVLVATSLTMVVGILQFIMGISRLGFLTIYLSEPLTRGFTTGAACHVFTSQITHIFGIKVQRFSGPLKLIYTYIDLFKNIKSIVWAALIIAIISIVILYLTKEYLNPLVKKKINAPVPVELLVVIIATLASYFGKFEQKFNLRVVGNIPMGIPVPQIPLSSLFIQVAGDAFAISIVSFAISVSMANIFSKKHNYEIDSNQELKAYGIMNTVSSMFNCFVSSVSLSRSLMQDQVGGKTQIASLVSCSLILVVLLAVAKLFEQLPNAVLAGIIIVALKGMFMQFSDLKKLWYISKYDFAIWLVVFLATVLLDVDMGLGIGVAFSLLTVIFRTQRPYTAVLGRIPNTDIYKDITVIKEAQQIKGIKIFRFEGSLYYANREHFISKIFSKTNLNPRKFKLRKLKLEKQIATLDIKSKSNDNEHVESNYKCESIQLQNDIPSPDYHTIIIDCSTMGFIDSVGVSTLSQIMAEYDDIKVNVVLANCKSGITEMLNVAGFFEKIGKERIFLSIHDAVLSSLKSRPDEFKKLLRRISRESQTFANFIKIVPEENEMSSIEESSNGNEFKTTGI